MYLDDILVFGPDFGTTLASAGPARRGRAETKGLKVSALPGGDPVPRPHSVGRGNRRGSG